MKGVCKHVVTKRKIIFVWKTKSTKWYFTSGSSVSDVTIYFFSRKFSDLKKISSYLYQNTGDVCERTPLWGIRFHCSDCKDIDLCEECYDFRRNSEKFTQVAPSHIEGHDWNVVEVIFLALLSQFFETFFLTFDLVQRFPKELEDSKFMNGNVEDVTLFRLSELCLLAKNAKI